MKTIVNEASRLPQPFVRRCRKRTVAKVDSIGFVVRKCPQCSAGRVPLEQIQLSLGHASIQTTERYLGVRQDLHDAPYDRLGLDILAP